MSQMIEVKVAEAEGAVLDWMVAMSTKQSLLLIGSHPHLLQDGQVIGPFRPSTDWSQGGPLIEKHGCDLNCISAANCWEANCWDSGSPNPDLHLCEAEAPLIAACRAIVTAKLGDKVMVPVELINNPEDAQPGAGN
jgi:hypothetical protein